jgi:hypothetical protein
MIYKRVAVLWVIAAVVISSLLTFTVGTAYLDRRIEQGIAESKIIDARVDTAFQGLCDILLFSLQPAPRPPIPEESDLPDPTSPYGKKLAEYNRDLAKRQAEGRARVSAAVERYHGRR